MKQAYCEALEVALDFEKEGMRHYKEALLKVEDKFAKKALEFLIKEEEEHIDKILRFNNFLLGSGEFDSEVECAIELPEKIHALIVDEVDRALEKLSSVGSDIEVYKSAMELEKRGFEMYAKNAEVESDERVRNFFNFLMEEEKMHYKLLQDSIRYLEDPSYYFEDAGGWIFA